MEHSPLLDVQRRLSPDLALAPALDGTWELPARFHRDPAVEYGAVRVPEGAGLIDRSWRGALHLRGRDRLTFLQGMVSNDVLALGPGQSCRAALLDSTGHMLADMQVHVLEDAVLLEADPRCLPTLSRTLDKYLIMEKVLISDVSQNWAILSVRGPGAGAVVRETYPGLAEPRPPVPAREGEEGPVMAFAVGSGVDLWMPPDRAPGVWERLVAAGAVPVGEEAAEVIRVEAGEPAWGRELTEAVLLPEADLSDAVSYTKGCYVGQEIVARLQARGHTNRALRQIVLDHTAPVPPPGATLHVPEDGPEPGREVGRVTSAVLSPARNERPLALGYVRREYFAPGTPLDVQILQPDGTMFSYHGAVV